MKRFHWIALVLCLQIGWSGSSRADSFTTNIVSGTSTNIVGDYVLGDTGSLNYLEINSGGVLACGTGLIGYTVSASNNAALITGQ